jgi:hypothetical protein
MLTVAGVLKGRNNEGVPTEIKNILGDLTRCDASPGETSVLIDDIR